MSTRILHLSDLHIGARRARQDATFGVALRSLTGHLDPELVVVSGDLTHRGTAKEHVAAADFLRGLERPLLVVPGNHDMPLTLPGRLTHPFANFERVWQTTTPTFSSDEVQAVGLCSARPLRHQGGSVPSAQLDQAVATLAEGASDACRVVVLHHQLAGAPWRSRKRPLWRRSHVLARLQGAGAELIVAGHIHQASASAGHEFAVEPLPVVVTTAPGVGRPRPRRRGEACGVLAYRVEPATITVETHVWREPNFELTASRVFSRGAGTLDVAASEALAVELG